MTETREGLEARKRELFDAIRTLQRDHEDGTIDEDAYQVARRRYEVEAALVMERLDTLHDGDAIQRAGRSRTWWIAVLAAGLLSAAVLLFLLGALHQRGGNAGITGDVPTVPATPSAIQLAERQATDHPRSVMAQLALGNAYLDAGMAGRADRAYRRAMQLDPGTPVAPTLHAMALGALGRSHLALAQLAQVEHRHPAYARAWLLDGVIAARTPAGHARARRAWRVFLRLQPHSSVSRNVRVWLRELR
jgi:cytochrome c-type biogenesis protein CcmH/NrfG